MRRSGCTGLRPTSSARAALMRQLPAAGEMLLPALQHACVRLGLSYQPSSFADGAACSFVSGAASVPADMRATSAA